MPRRRVLAIGIPIVIIAILIPIESSSTNLFQFNHGNSQQIFVSRFNNILEKCTTATGLALSNCKQSIGSLEVQCELYNHPPICNDSRINGIISSYTPHIKIQNSSNFTTYTSTKFGFSIDYPNDWVSYEYPQYWNETLIANFTDKQQDPNVIFVIKEWHNTGESFKDVTSKYLNDTAVPGFPIKLQSQDKVLLANKETYRIQYTQTLGDISCWYEDYAIDDGEFVPIISFSHCDEATFKQFLPIYEKIVSTFKTLW